MSTLPLRIIGALGVAVSAAVHLKLWADGYRDVHTIGPAFMLNAVAGALICVLLLAWRHWIAALLTMGFGASTLGAFVVSATVGLFGLHESWVGGYVWAAAVAEVVAVATGAALLLHDRKRLPLPHRHAGARAASQGGRA